MMIKVVSLMTIGSSTSYFEMVVEKAWTDIGALDL